MPRRKDPDEGPSPDDLDRFGDDAPRTAADAICPDCGAPVWSEADVCPKCFSYLGGEAVRARRRGYFAKHWKLLVVILLLVARAQCLGKDSNLGPAD